MTDAERYEDEKRRREGWREEPRPHRWARNYDENDPEDRPGARRTYEN